MKLLPKLEEIVIQREVKTEAPVEISEFCMLNLDITDRLLGRRCNVVRVGDAVFYGKTLGFRGKVRILEAKRGVVRYIGGAGNWALHANGEIIIRYKSTDDGTGTYANCKLVAFASGMSAILLKWLRGALSSAVALMEHDAVRVAKLLQNHPDEVKSLITPAEWSILQQYWLRYKARIKRKEAKGKEAKGEGAKGKETKRK